LTIPINVLSSIKFVGSATAFIDFYEKIIAVRLSLKIPNGEYVDKNMASFLTHRIYEDVARPCTNTAGRSDNYIAFSCRVRTSVSVSTCPRATIPVHVPFPRCSVLLSSEGYRRATAAALLMRKLLEHRGKHNQTWLVY